MKKILLILIIITMILSMAKSLEIPNLKAPDWWYELSDQEQWEYFRQMSIEYVRIDKIAKENIDISVQLRQSLQDSNSFLEKYKPFYPNWGMDINLILLLDYSLSFDTIVNFNFRKYFFKGHIFIMPGFDLKLYKRLLISESGVGGGLNFGIGFTF